MSTQPRVEAGDRALETARKIIAIAEKHGSDLWHFEDDVVELIQSAMNERERLLVKTLENVQRLLKVQLVEGLDCADVAIMHDEIGAILRQERLLAERGGTQ